MHDFQKQETVILEIVSHVRLNLDIDYGSMVPDIINYQVRSTKINVDRILVQFKQKIQC